MIPTYFKTIPFYYPRIEDVPVGGLWPVQFSVSPYPNRIRVQLTVPAGQRWTLRLKTEPEPDTDADIIPSFQQVGTSVFYDSPDMKLRPPTVARVFLARRQS